MCHLPAIVAGCLPAFAISFKRFHSTRFGCSSGKGGAAESQRRQQGIPLATIGSGPSFAPNRSVWSAHAGSSSQDDILHKPDEITVVRTVDVDGLESDSQGPTKINFSPK